MSYRLLPPCPHPKMPIIHSATQTDVVVDNGTIAHVNIPFFRKYSRMISRKDIMEQDHVGWPSPDNKDKSWQAWMSFNSYPIILKDEGYDSVEIAFAEPIDGLTAVGHIEGHVVRINITSLCLSAVEHDLFVPFSAYIVGDNLRDIAAKGIIHIVAGPINEEVDNDSD